MRTLFAACLILFTCIHGHAQSYEYGKPSELKGLKKVFIDTGSDVAERNKIADLIEKAKLDGLEILDSADGAEILLVFAGSREQRNTGNPKGLLFDPNNVKVGTGVVLIPGHAAKKMRLLMSVEQARDSIWKSNPSTKFVKDFISAYKKANGVK